MSITISPLSDVKSAKIGDGTAVWQYAVIVKGAVVGSECKVYQHCYVGSDVVIGNRVTLKNGACLQGMLRVEDDVFIGPNVVFDNDVVPRIKVHRQENLATTIRQGASIGANATVLLGVSVGKNAVVGANAVVTQDVPPNAIIVGNPAHIVGYIASTPALQAQVTASATGLHGKTGVSSVKGVALYQLPVVEDLRGTLSFAEYGQYLPFIPKRYFLVYNVQSREVRGEHAHRALHQFLVCVKGSCTVMVDDGKNREEFILDSPGTALHIPPMVWGIQYRHSADAVLLVLASDTYSKHDYIRDYDEFIRLASESARE